MPAQANKKGAAEKTPAVQRYQEDTVQKCMYWPEPEPPKQKGKGGAGGKKGGGAGRKKEKKQDPPPAPEAPVRFLPRGSPEVGRVTVRVAGWEAPSPPPAPDHSQDDTAIKALRGWSDSNPNEESMLQPPVPEEPPAEETEKKQAKKKKKGGGAAGKGQKQGEEGKKGLMSEFDDDVHMGDILSYKFGNEEAEKRFRQQEREQAKRDRAEEQAAASKKAMRTVKHTQASIARTNKNIEKVTAVEQDLWKMSKFKNAEPAIDTRRKGGGQGGSGAPGSGGKQSNGFGGGGGYGFDGYGDNTAEFGGGCTCHNGEPNRALEDEFAEVNLDSPNLGGYTAGGGVGGGVGYTAGYQSPAAGGYDPCAGILNTNGYQNVGGYQSPVGGGYQGYPSPAHLAGMHQPPVGYQSPGVGNQSPGVGYQSPGVGFQSPVPTGAAYQAGGFDYGDQMPEYSTNMQPEQYKKSVAFEVKL